MWVLVGWHLPELACMRIPYGDITRVYRKTHVIVAQVIFKLEITKIILYKKCCVLILLYVVLTMVTNGQIFGIIWTIWRYLSYQERIITLDELEKIFHMFSNSIDCKSLHKVEWDLKKVSNLIPKINDYGVENKHNLT
jgi:hypothetical protein